MAITLNAASKARALYSTLDTIAHTVDAGTGSNRLLVAILIQRGTLRTISSITYNSTAMSLAVSQDVTGQQLRASIYYLVAPSTGSNDIDITYVGSQGQTEIMAMVFEGVAQTSPLDDYDGAEGSSDSPSVTVTPTADGQAIVAGVLHEASTAGTVGSGETSLWDTDQGAWATSGSYVIQTTAAAQAMDWSFGSSDVWTAVGASFKAAGGGAVSLTVADIAHSAAIESPSLTQHNVLAAQEIAHTLAAESFALTQHNILAAQDIDHALELEAFVLTQHNVLAAQDIAHALATDEPALTQHNALEVQDIWHNLTMDGPVFGEIARQRRVSFPWFWRIDAR